MQEAPTSLKPEYGPSGELSSLHAWLFQYTPGEQFAQWRLEPGADRSDLWSAGDMGGEIRPDDVVFFWQRGADAGLRGMGHVLEVRGAGDTYEVRVKELAWGGSVIALGQLLQGGLIDQVNLLANGHAPVLRLAPAEAQALAAQLGSSLPPGFVDWHAPGERWAKNPPLRQLFTAVGIDDATPMAEHVVDMAVRLNANGLRALTTAALAVALANPVGDAQSPEMRCVAAFAAAVQATPNLSSAFNMLRSSEPFRAPPLADDDMAQTVLLLRHALAVSGRVYSRRTLSADALVAALLNTASPLLDQALARSAGSIDMLRSEFLNALDRIDPGLIKRMDALLMPIQRLDPVEATRAPAKAQAPSSPPPVTPSTASSSPPEPATSAQAPGSPPPASPAVTPPPPADDTPVLTAWQGITIAAPGNDDPWARDLDDKLGVKDEAQAFARLALSADFRPPLAVGIFGEWGAGKSFFMRLMHEHVERLDKGIPSEAAPEAGSSDFHRPVVQIRFNAWHYVDTNLWASLVDHIFTELDRWAHARDATQAEALFENLATARELTLDAAARLVRRREQQKAAAEQLARAERALADAKRPTIAAYWQALWTMAKSDDEVRHDVQSFDKAAAELGLPELEKQAVALRDSVGGAGDEAARAKLLASGFKAQLGAWHSVALFLALCIALPALLLWTRDALAGVTGSEFFAQIRGEVLGAAGALAALAGVFGRATARARRYLDRLSAAKESLDQAVRRQVGESQTEAEVEKQQRTLAQRAGDVAEARATLAATSDRLAEAAREYSTGTGHGRLLRFVRDKASGGDYAKHLGLVATVRKDFEELAANMRSSDEEPAPDDEQKKRIEQYKAQVDALIAKARDSQLLLDAEISKLEESAAEPAPCDETAFRRIILYIDDLDRCPPDKVVEVLQAVHLLLTFSLFVVVVAVDVRWVSRALERHYPDLLDDPATDSQGRGAASAHDYLEKIFQIPYWVRPMSEASSIDFLSARAADVVRTRSVAAPPPSPPAVDEHRLDQLEEPARGDAPVGAPLDASRPAGTGASGPLRPDAAATGAPQSPIAKAKAKAKDEPPADASRTLRIEPGEEDFMKLLAPYVGGSPRRALRFLNVYRVIKASLGEAEVNRLAGRGGYRALMTQLAVATGAPALLDGWLTLLANAPADADLDAARELLQREYWYLVSPERARLDGALAVFARGMPGPGQMEALRRYAPLARRYSFTG